ncbi:MAG: SOS response-associated peptidase [Zhaonellaceae bacterium]|jgi:putative SOS response-associated peptidase YedK|nr:SOS response-associated peptidase [Clostridia bacterium]
MCGRFSAVDIVELYKQFQIENSVASLVPRYNIAPSQEIPAIISKNNKNELMMLRWGLVPNWAKDPSIGYKIINARAETIDIKPSFRHLITSRRCLIPADGFYEWKKEGKIKKPYRFILQGGKPFTFAGLWDSWTNQEGKIINSCTIITTRSNALIEPIHDRMPVILTKENEKLWIDQDLKEQELLKSLLKPYPEYLMEAYEVSSVVNSPKVDDERCIARAAV